MDDPRDEIVNGLARALEAIEDHAEKITDDPALAAWIESVSESMAALQTYLDENLPGERLGFS